MNWFSKFFSRNTPSPDDLLPAPLLPAFERAPAQQSDGRPLFSGASAGLRALTARDGGARMRAALARAFTPSQPVASVERLAGRDELLSRIIRAVEDQQLHVVLYGDRGIGKTSILRVVAELARGAHYVVHYTSCGEGSEFCATFRDVAAEIKLLYDAEVDPTADDVQAGGTLADKLPDGSYSVSQLTQLFETVSGTRVLLILDEFDRASSPGFRASVAELIKNLSDRSIAVQLLIAGVAANLNELIAQVPSIRRNIVGIPVSVMADAEIGAMVDIAEQHGGVRFDAAARDGLVRLSGGLPYLAALIGQHALIAAADANSATVSLNHVATAQQRATDDVVSRLSPLSRHLLDSSGAGAATMALLADAARVAMRNDGAIADAAVIARLAALSGQPQAQLLTPVPDDPRGAWRFAEDGVSTYLWLSHTQISAAS